MIALFVAAVALAAVSATAATYVADNGFPTYLLPELSWPRRQVAPALPAGPYFCDATKRWRDPVTKKFVARPAV